MAAAVEENQFGTGDEVSNGSRYENLAGAGAWFTIVIPGSVRPAARTR